MSTNTRLNLAAKDDAEPLKVTGAPIPFSELMATAEIQSQDISDSLNRFAASTPPQYQELID